jgi:integrase
MTCAAEGAGGIKEAIMHTSIPSFVGFAKTPWNKGRLIGQKRPLRPREVWAFRVRLQLEQRRRDLALFNLAIDSKLRGCNLVRLRVSDVCVGGRVQDRATIIQRKTGRPVQFEITEQTRAAIRDWLANKARAQSGGGARLAGPPAVLVRPRAPLYSPGRMRAKTLLRLYATFRA